MAQWRVQFWVLPPSTTAAISNVLFSAVRVTAMSLSVTLSRTHLLPTQPQIFEFHSLSLYRSNLKFASFTTLHRLQASRRVPNFPQGNGNLVDDPRNWSRSIDFGRTDDVLEEDEEDDDNDDEEDDRSLDLLIQFVQNVFKKISRRARRAVRSVLPVAIPTKLVGFSVNGVLILAFLWVLKAFLEVVCTLGSIVFVSILLIRGLWTGVIYFQESRNMKINRFDDENNAWNGAQPAT